MINWRDKFKNKTLTQYEPKDKKLLTGYVDE